MSVWRWWLRPRWSLRRTLLLLGILVLWLGGMTAQAASNTLPSPAGRVSDLILGVDVNQFKPPECAGIPIDNLIVADGSGNAINGTLGNDLMLGTSGSDQLNGLDGDDCIVGGGGDDGWVLLWFFGIPLFPVSYLQGGAGNDVILGGPGEDVIDGGDGNDALYGEGDRDVLQGSAGDDYLDGGSGSDYCNGGNGSDTVVNCP